MDLSTSAACLQGILYHIPRTLSRTNVRRTNQPRSDGAPARTQREQLPQREPEGLSHGTGGGRRKRATGTPPRSFEPLGDLHTFRAPPLFIEIGSVSDPPPRAAQPQWERERASRPSLRSHSAASSAAKTRSGTASKCIKFRTFSVFALDFVSAPLNDAVLASPASFRGLKLLGAKNRLPAGKSRKSDSFLAKSLTFSRVSGIIYRSELQDNTPLVRGARSIARRRRTEPSRRALNGLRPRECRPACRTQFLPANFCIGQRYPIDEEGTTRTALTERFLMREQRQTSP